MSNDIPRFDGLFAPTIGRMTSTTLSFRPSGVVHRPGIDQPDGTVVQHNGEPNLIVVRVPGHNYWAARGQQGYAPATYQIFWLVEALGDNRYKAAELGDVNVRGIEDLDRAKRLAERVDWEREQVQANG